MGMSTPNPQFDPVEDVIAAVKDGQMVIVTDDRDRENEGDLVAIAQLTTPQIVNFMAREGRGLICAPVDPEIADRLELPAMVSRNRESQKTDFTVSVDAAVGVTTGISAFDRARTLRVLGDPEARPSDLVQPGHVLPLRAKTGGVLRRAGHTEAAVDLARLAGCSPAGVICEIMNEDGSMARLPDLLKFRDRHGLKICTIESLIAFRSETEQLVQHEEKIFLPTDYGRFELHMYTSCLDGKVHLALVKGEIGPDEPVLVRVHSECLTGDVFGSMRCDCGGQLAAALKQIEKEGRGVLVYMRQEGRGIGLKGKIRAYKLQEEGLDTVEANERLGFPMDLREYGLGAQILRDLGVRKIKLLTNNPRKLVGLDGYGLQIVSQMPIRTEPNPHNEAYLRTKKLKMGHFL